MEMMLQNTKRQSQWKQRRLADVETKSTTAAFEAGVRSEGEYPLHLKDVAGSPFAKNGAKPCGASHRIVWHFSTSLEIPAGSHCPEILSLKCDTI
jgi:hypothetical protein